MLSKTKYAVLCIVGIEIFYVLCTAYGFTLSGRRMELHHSLFELLPLFVWGTVESFFLGAVSLGIFAGVFGWYVAWMHNVSLVSDASLKA